MYSVAVSAPNQFTKHYLDVVDDASIELYRRLTGIILRNSCSSASKRAFFSAKEESGGNSTILKMCTVNLPKPYILMSACKLALDCSPVIRCLWNRSAGLIEPPM